MNNRKKIAIIGVGLIGGSLALRLHEKKLSSIIYGVDNNELHAAKALELELVDEMIDIKTAIKNAEVLILTIPVNTICKILPEIMDQIQPNQIVMDAGSTKADILDVIQDHPLRKRFVATHPMWGTEYSGPEAAVDDAFTGKSVIICNKDQSDEDALAWVATMYQKIGMQLLEMNGIAHDMHTAYISHISHITSFALANTVLQKEQEHATIFDLASSGFESTVRLAKSNAAMWVPILSQNKKNVLDVLDEHITQLQKFKVALESDNNENLQQLILEANQIKKILK